ncbi:MAG TPA: menaquinone biosynthesis protein [Terriglobia bacterium]|nr:menaquinone biosynthesis protein [Terriglobia bacterium]
MSQRPKPRVSVVQYLNTAPLVWGMLHGAQRGRFELEFTTPARCADHLRDQKVDVGIIPAIEYQRIDGLEIIPGVSIASKAPVRSVLLFSRVPLEEVGTVAMDNSSRTSVALTTILLRKFYRRDFTSLPANPDPEAMLAHGDAALVIGDPALTWRGSVEHVYDLAAEWRKFTGLPFVFAVWAVRARQGDAAPAGLTADFAASRDYGLAHLDEIAAEYASRFGMTVEDVKVYLTENIDYTLDEENLKGLRLFYRLARELDLIPAEKDLHFVGSEQLPESFVACGSSG